MWEMIKKAARWVVSGFRWLGMGLIPADKPPVISSPVSELYYKRALNSGALHFTNNSQDSKQQILPQTIPYESKSCHEDKEDKHESHYSHSGIEDIPGIQDIIRGYTDDDLNDSAGYTGSPITLFGHKLSVQTLLQHIVRGEQDKAENMIKANCNLLSITGTVTDEAKRTFKNITAFQYAIWAKDRHMWNMIMKYLPKNEAAQQLLDHESETKKPGYVKEHGKHYDFSPLIQGLQSHVNYLNGQNIDWTVADQMWQQGVGGPQRKLPAHVVNEYCREDRPFYPLPTFKENHLPRAGGFFFNWLTNTISSWFSSAVDTGLGFNFAIYRDGGGRSTG